MTPRPLTDSERAELRELLAKATPPPWGGVEDECGGKEEYYGHWHLIGPLSLMGRELHDDSRALLALRNHADALLDAADELARLKAGAPLVWGEVYLRAGSMSGKTDTLAAAHATHFDDCGCRSARYEAEIARLKAKLAAVREHAATFDNAGGESAFMSIVDCPYNEPLHYHHDGCPECTEHAPSTTFRDDAATTPEGHEDTTSDTASINAAISKLQDTIERARMAAAAGDLHGALDALEGKK